jgi:glucan phosphoethanolaminetransferase (alkaline phosphatase superfamily)
MRVASQSSTKHSKRARQTNSHQNITRICAECGSETRWLSVEGTCWDCTVKAAKNKVPLYIEQQEDDLDIEANTGLLNEI